MFDYWFAKHVAPDDTIVDFEALYDYLHEQEWNSNDTRAYFEMYVECFRYYWEYVYQYDEIFNAFIDWDRVYGEIRHFEVMCCFRAASAA